MTYATYFWALHAVYCISTPDMTDLSDHQLIQVARTGNAEAIGVLYERHLPFMLNASRSYAGGHTEPLDLVHEAWVRILGELDRFTPRKSFRAWAVTVLRNLGRDTASRRVRCRELLDQHGHDLGEVCVEIRLELGEEEAREWIGGAMRSLTPRQRTALRLHVGEQRSSVEVGRALGCAPPTVRSTCHFALNRIRSRLDRSDREFSVMAS